MSCVVDDVEAMEDWLEHRVEWIWRRGIKLGGLVVFLREGRDTTGPFRPHRTGRRTEALIQLARQGADQGDENRANAGPISPHDEY